MASTFPMGDEPTDMDTEKRSWTRRRCQGAIRPWGASR
jgi:hypothetical protein